MLVTLRFPKQHHSWPFGVTSIVAKVQELCLGSIGIWLQLHCHFQQDMFSRSCSKMTWIGKRSLAENRGNPPFYADWEKNGPMSLVPVVDGSEIPQQPPGMYSTLANNGISTTNLNWLAEFLNHQRYQLGLWNNRSTSHHIYFFWLSSFSIGLHLDIPTSDQAIPSHPKRRLKTMGTWRKLGGRVTIRKIKLYIYISRGSQAVSAGRSPSESISNHLYNLVVKLTDSRWFSSNCRNKPA